MSSLGTLVPTAACLAYTVVYVGSLYVLPRVYDLLAGTDRSAMSAPRDDPRVIRRRLLAASAGTVCNLVILWAILQHYGAIPEVRLQRASALANMSARLAMIPHCLCTSFCASLACLSGPHQRRTVPAVHSCSGKIWWRFLF